MRDMLERHQVRIYFAAVALGTLAAMTTDGTARLQAALGPALAFMLFVTFLQVPLARIGQGLRDLRFLAALLASNFLVLPLLALLLSHLAPQDALLRLGLLMVLLTPCIDYVITFAHLGRADARLLLAATPILLLAQMALLPLYLAAFLGPQVAGLIGIGPFLHAFAWLIALPLGLAAALQHRVAGGGRGKALAGYLGLMPVPATALVLFLVVAAMLPLLGASARHALAVLPLYLAFAVAAPLLGWTVARGFALPDPAAQAVAFSSGTRNSLVILPLALAIPGAIPILPAVIVTQTLVELLAELAYIRVLPMLRGRHGKGPRA